MHQEHPHIDEMDQMHSPLEKDKILRDAFEKLKPRGVESVWSYETQPYTALLNECQQLIEDERFSKGLRDYIRVHTTLPRGVEMLFTCISMAARARWEDVPDGIKPVVARGWFLGRWLPTFLIIDGPVGRFLSANDSPFTNFYGPNWPIVTAAKDFLGERTFKLVRNGFAHWGFDWEVVGENSCIVTYDWERDLPVAKLHQAEADAYHIVVFALIEVINDIILHGRSRMDRDI